MIVAQRLLIAGLLTAWAGVCLAAPPSGASSALTATPAAPTSQGSSAGAAAPGQSADVKAARMSVERLQDTLLKVMQDGKKLGYDGRYRELDPVVRKVFDFPLISRAVMGQDWDKLDSRQQGQLRDMLAKLSVSSYAKEFDSYSGERFVYGGSQSIGGRLLVDYTLESGGDKHRFDYQMQRNDAGAWQITNVIVDGVSDLALKSGQYRALFAKQGYAALIAWISKQIKANAEHATA
ncbi:MAG TPA: ABC transporter substrate-binding protein [Nevskiaceae bacterium]